MNDKQKNIGDIMHCWVWQQIVSSDAKLLLLAISEFSNEDGQGACEIQKLSAMCGTDNLGNALFELVTARKMHIDTMSNDAMAWQICPL